jgi:hypothetical protein
MLKNKNDAVKALTGGIEGYLFGKYKVDYRKGLGSFISANEVKIAMNDGSEEIVGAKNVIIATGSEVTPFPGMEIDEKSIVSSTGALDLQEVPKKVRLHSELSARSKRGLGRSFDRAKLIRNPFLSSVDDRHWRRSHRSRARVGLVSTGS